ncbi:hypothetical protein SAMN05216312_102559 [Cohnella sp. OV330]|uniref:hypothetical protein n=1 Tax=Cohnella sp. OV330 TaxID=1855288 RepID=UPI0008ECC1D7|nr:hypothetical protein [Cohnella sp. OV330]SFA96638.1 hypothetical protein SAMN05216312_102559 [Cohnella sp. OV330]
MYDEQATDGQDHIYEGRDNYDMDIDRMINEGLGGGQVTLDNGLIEETTTDTMREKEGDDPS